MLSFLYVWVCWFYLRMDYVLCFLGFTCNKGIFYCECIPAYTHLKSLTECLAWKWMPLCRTCTPFSFNSETLLYQHSVMEWTFYRMVLCFIASCFTTALWIPSWQTKFEVHGSLSRRDSLDSLFQFLFPFVDVSCFCCIKQFMFRVFSLLFYPIRIVLCYLRGAWIKDCFHHTEIPVYVSTTWHQ